MKEILSVFLFFISFSVLSQEFNPNEHDFSDVFEDIHNEYEMKKREIKEEYEERMENFEQKIKSPIYQHIHYYYFNRAA